MWVVDSNRLAFNRAEQYHQFHDGIGAPPVWRVLEGSGLPARLPSPFPPVPSILPRIRPQARPSSPAAHARDRTRSPAPPAAPGPCARRQGLPLGLHPGPEGRHGRRRQDRPHRLPRVRLVLRGHRAAVRQAPPGSEHSMPAANTSDLRGARGRQHGAPPAAAERRLRRRTNPHPGFACSFGLPVSIRSCRCCDSRARALSRTGSRGQCGGRRQSARGAGSAGGSPSRNRASVHVMRQHKC